MLTRIQIRNFKLLEDVSLDLGQMTVFVGPNNSGKTAALQALSLWHIGVQKWSEKRSGRQTPEKRPGVTINRNDLLSMPVPTANLLWRDLHTRTVSRVAAKTRTKNIRIEIVVDGLTGGETWSCGLEFDYANEESIYCRPLRLDDNKIPARMPVPAQAVNEQVTYLPPMSGLAATEPRWQPGRVRVLMGEGQTAQVLRNLCYEISSKPQGDGWTRLTRHIKELFGVALLPPDYITERGEITMGYKDHGGTRLDLSSSGRGLQQTLLLLAHLYANPNSVVLLDEPDAHLEILRQRQIYTLLTDIAESQGCQVLAASHSEVVLNEAAAKDVVIAFVGQPHRIDDQGAQLVKSLRDIGFDQYYQAEQTGWVLYLEGSTDLAILQQFAAKLNHEAAAWLERPFVHYVGNQPNQVKTHFYGLREAKPDLVGVAIFDRLEQGLPPDLPMTVEVMQWKRREIENYFCTQEVLLAFAQGDDADDLFSRAEGAKRQAVMEATIEEISHALRTLGKPDIWSEDIKASDDVFKPLFDKYFARLNLPNILRKRNYHALVRYLSAEDIPAEVVDTLDVIAAVAQKANPR